MRRISIAQELMAQLERLLPQLEDYLRDEELQGQIEDLERENIRLKNHIIGQDKAIAELRAVRS